MERTLYTASVFLAIAALILLVVFSAIYGTGNHVVGTAIFGAVLISFYIGRAANAFFNHDQSKQAMNTLNSILLYLLIASTYTPITLILPQRTWGWSVFGVAWGITLIVIALKLFTSIKSKRITALLYGSFFILDMTAFTVVHNFLHPLAFFWLGLGGLAYLSASLGSIYAPRLSAIFILFGSFAHFWGMLEQILRTSTSFS